MNKKTLISEEKDKKDNYIKCASSGTRKYITKFMRNCGWNYEDFSTILEGVGLVLPVYLRIIDVKTETYTYATILASGCDYQVKIVLTLNPENSRRTGTAIFDIKGENEEKEYYLYNKDPEKPGMPIRILLRAKKVKKYNHILDIVYGTASFEFSLKLENDCFVDIEFYRKINIGAKEWKYFIEGTTSEYLSNEFQSQSELEEYLLSLDYSSISSETFEKIKELIDFPGYDAEFSFIHYDFCYGKEVLIRGSIK